MYDSRFDLPNPVPPSIASVSPTGGGPGTSVTITGTNFGATQGTSVVKFAGTTASPTSWSDTSITAPVPTSASSGQVTVTVGGVVNTCQGTCPIFSVFPSITSLSPQSAAIGESITISGANLGTPQGTSTVAFFNGVQGAPTQWSGSSITVPVPAGATTGPVVVTVGGNASNGASLTVLQPTMASLSATSGLVGDPITITGSHFLASQPPASGVTFNGVAASVASWSDTSIATSVPAGATTGPVVVTVFGQPTNSQSFTVFTTGTVAGTITKTAGGGALQGATVQAVLIGAIKGTATTAADGTYSIPDMPPGTYDVRVHATNYSSEVRSGTIITIHATTTVNVAMSQPGTVSGTVTQADGTTPISGAAVTVFLGGIEKGSTQTNGAGAYAIGNLHPGAYTVQAVNVGNRTKEQGATILEATNTVSNLAMDPVGTGPVTYAYDELGRLVLVVDPSGDAATYTYDAVGNILSIGRIGAGTVAIVEYTPNGAPVGSTVTLFGTGFSPTAAQNGVTFNGTPASVTSSTSTQIVTTVPAGATSGPIGVATPSGSATTSTNFVVATASGAPTITGFTPVVASTGATLTIDGTNFDPVAANDRLTLNVAFAMPSAVTPTSMTTTIPGAATSGRVTVATAEGTAVATSDLFIPPPGFTPADVGFTGRLGGYGDANLLQVPIGTAGKIGLALFDGEPGHRVSVKLSASTIGSGVVKTFRPNGTVVSQATFGTSLLVVDPQPLYQQGSFSILVDPAGTNTGSVTLKICDVVDFTGTLAPDADGDAVTAPFDTPGQTARYTFAGTQNQRVSLLISPGPLGPVTILAPDGSTVATGNIGVFNSFVDVQSLPQTGTYTLMADPMNAGTGSVTLTLYDVPADLSGTLAINGNDELVSIATPGRNAAYGFSADTTQSVRVLVTNNSYTSTTLGGCVRVKLMQGTTQLESVSSCAATFELPAHSIDQGNNYSVVVDPQSNATGSLRVKVVSP